MADFKDSTADTDRASTAQLLDLADQIDQARHAAIVTKLATSAAVPDRNDRSALEFAFLDLDDRMRDLGEAFNRLVLGCRPLPGAAVPFRRGRPQ